MNLNLNDLQALTATNSKLGVQLSNLDKPTKSKLKYDLLYNLVIDTAKGNKHQFTIDKSFLANQTENEGWGVFAVPNENIVLFAKIDKLNNPSLITKFYQGIKATPVMTGKNIAELLLEKNLLENDTISQMFKLEQIDSPKGTTNCTFYSLVKANNVVEIVQETIQDFDTEGDVIVENAETFVLEPSNELETTSEKWF